MKTVSAFLFLFFCALGYSATPITDGRFTGTLNSVQSGAVFTWQSGSTISVDAGATVTGLQRTNSTLTTLAGITFSSFSQGLFPLTTRTAYFDAIAPSPTSGDLLYYNGTHWVPVAIGTTGQVLTVASGLPSWAGSAAGAPSTATYITQTADAGLSNEFAMGSLGTGLVKNATTTGIPSIAVAGTDYVAPGTATTSGLTMSTSRLLGRTTASTGAIEELTFSGMLDQIGNTRGALLERGASGWTVVAPGTSGYVWTSNGSGSDPSWQAASGGGSISGSTGSTDNAILRADGTGGATIQGSGATLADDGGLTATYFVSNQTNSSNYSTSDWQTPTRHYTLALGGSGSASPNLFYLYDQTATAVRLSLNTSGLFTINQALDIGDGTATGPHLNINSSTAPYFQFSIGSTAKASFGAAASSGDFFTGSTAGQLVLKSDSAQGLAFSANGSSKQMELLSSGDLNLPGNIVSGGTLPSNTSVYFERSGFSILTMASTAQDARIRMVRPNNSKSAMMEFIRGTTDEWYMGAPYTADTPDGSGNQFVFNLYDGSVHTFLAITASGVISFPAYGAGTLTTDASGNITATSDARLKNILGSFNRGVFDLLKIRPVNFRWNKESGNETEGTYSGFTAQNIEAAIPEAVGHMSNGMMTLQDRAILATLVNANRQLFIAVVALALLVVALTFNAITIRLRK